MEKKLSLNWDIYNNEIGHEFRYCHNCGKKVEFRDSLKRRQNANGKNIYYYAIYKCPNEHTWNKTIAVFKTISGLKNVDGEYSFLEDKCDELSFTNIKKKGFLEITITLNTVQKKIRLDKLLSSKVKDSSRTEIVRLINEGYIKVNENEVKSNVRLKEYDVISILLV